jgi:2-dehydro-3-deoxyphosphogluconate aldolase/(4S)-4-hydroxy-2-oxoglutarate aldolase
MKKLADYIPRQRLMPLIFPHSVEQVVDDTAAYRDAGFKVVEILCRSDCAIESIARVRKLMPDLFIGAGTVLTLDTAGQAKQAGAEFLVSPGTDPVILDYAVKNGLDMIPGIYSPSEVAVALRYGFTIQKFFPAEPHGLEHLDALASPFGHTPVKMICGRGIEKHNAEAYLKHKLVGAIIADWILAANGTPRLREELAAAQVWLKSL